MNALVRKEVRSILPAWIVALVLAILPVWIIWPGSEQALFQNLGITVFGPFGLGVLLVSLTPFGQELNWGTFQVLLSQPVPRRRLWLIKVAVAAAALGSAFVVLCISNHLRVDSVLESMKHSVWRNAFERGGEQNRYFTQLIADTRRGASLDTILVGGLEVLAGFAGGLWTTLLFRQVTAAFWLTFLVPMGISVLASLLLRNLSDDAGRVGFALILGAYSTAGFFWAKRLFLRVEDTQWTGGVIALPNLADLTAGQGTSILRRNKRPLRALVRKELQGQQINLLLAAGLLLVHLGVVAFRRLGAQYLATHQSVAMTLEMVPLLWLVMPLLIGSVSIAEERKLGTFQSNLCLPASRRFQFLVKFVVAFALSILVGGILPLLVERLAPYKNAAGNPAGLAFLGGNRPMDSLQLIGSVALTFLALYASTLTRNALQAMGAGLSAAVLTSLVIALAQSADNLPDEILWRGPLIGLIGFPVMIVTIFLLAYRNYTKLLPDIRVWLRNGLILLGALFGTALVTTIVYHRAWEAWIAEEPSHRFTPAGFSFAEQQAPMFNQPDRHAHDPSAYLGLTLQDLTPALAAQLNLKTNAGALVAQVTPDGPADGAGFKNRDLIVRFAGNNISNSQDLTQQLAKTRPGASLPIEVVRNGSNLTLPITTGRVPDTFQLTHRRRSTPKIVAAGSQKAVVLPNGRLWLQHNQSKPFEQRFNNHGIVIWYKVGPQHTGFADGSDWNDVALNQSACFGIRWDGTLWDLSASGFGGTSTLVDHGNDWESISAGAQHFVALKSDGTLWQWGWRQTASGPKLFDWKQVGSDTDWTAVYDSWITVAIKADGSIWRWDWHSKDFDDPQPWLTGGCANPVSLTARPHAVAMVCRDGTLWIGGEDLTNSVYTRFIDGAEGRRGTKEMLRWRGDFDWKQIQFVGWGRAVGLKRDGTLWEWNANYGFGPAMGWGVPPKLPSVYSDWICVAEDDNAYLAMARDGKLCLWGDPQGIRYGWPWYRNVNPDGLLMPSRLNAREVADLGK